MRVGRCMRSVVGQLRGLPLAGLVACLEPGLNLKPLGHGRRQRRYSPLRCFWLFLAQVLYVGESCSSIVRREVEGRWFERQGDWSPNTAAYCTARQTRLKIGPMRQVEASLRECFEARDAALPLWQGRRVTVFDGTTLSMPDTPANQKRYPQPNSQKPGCGFPSLRMVVGLSLQSGALCHEAHGPLSVDETALFRTLAEDLPAGTVVLTDRYFSGYGQLYWLGERGIDFVIRKNAMRGEGSVRRIRRLGRHDWLVVWTKGTHCPDWMTPAQWKALPKEMLLREVSFTVTGEDSRTECITVVTSLLDPKAYPTSSFARLYRRRWQVETHLGEIKTTLGLDILRCKSPAMIEKELLMHRLAYNLVRWLMLQAAQAHDVPVERLSFHGSLTTVRAWAEWITRSDLSEALRVQAHAHLLEVLARSTLADRPHRSEPRCRKRRSKNYQLMTQPRAVFRENTFRHRRPKALN